MKRFLVFTAAAALGLGCISAQKFTSPGDIFLIPGEFTSNGIDCIGFVQYNYNDNVDSTTVGLYDEDFNVVKKITFCSEPEFYVGDSRNLMGMVSLSNCVYFFACQGVFENSDEYTFLESRRVAGDSSEIDGVYAKTFDGREVMSFDFPFVVNSSSDDSAALFDKGGKRYIGFDVYNEADNESLTLIYEIDKGSSKARQVAMHKSSRVRPTAPRSGETVSVELGEEVSAPAVVAVVSASGRTMLRHNVAAGERMVTLDTSRLTPGVYTVTIGSGASRREATKIVVR